MGSTGLIEQAQRYERAFDAVPGAPLAPSITNGIVRTASDAELLTGLREISALVRLAEAEQVRLAGEVARRSEIGDDSSLAKRMGQPTASRLVGQEAFLPIDGAARLTRVGVATRPREALTGEVLPPQRPHVALALSDGRIGVALASAIANCLKKIEHALDAAAIDELERQLVETAERGWSVEDLLGYLKRVPDMVDPDRAEPREEAIRKLARVTERHLDNGLLRFVLDLDPVSGGLFKTALDANSLLRRPQLLDADEAEAKHSARDGAEDRRSVAQRRVDAVRLVAKKALEHDEGAAGGTAVTVLVTMTEEALRTGLGAAHIAGVDEPISAATARHLAAEAEIIPVVLGGRSQVLDLGESRRFFTPAQRRAMAARDGGCTGPGCSAPPNLCDAAHIVPAWRGPTDLANGTLLCWWCHLLHDQHGWQIGRHGDGSIWWTPPPWTDPTGRPRPGGVPKPPRV